MQKTCYLCGAASLQEFASLGERAITSDGRIIPLAAHTAQCTTCGLMQKLQSHANIFSHLNYQQNYDLYERPNIKQFDHARAHAYADWIAQFFPDTPRQLNVLEVGCGAGWILEILQSRYPEHRFEGIEPSLSATEAAAASGVKVTAGTLDSQHTLMPGSYDVVFSVNVIEHTPDPVAFIAAQKHLATPQGRVLTICPNSDVISIEFLFIDHVYSVRRSNLEAIFLKAGIEPLHGESGQHTMGELQVLTGAPTAVTHAPEPYACPQILIEKRVDYLDQWRNLDDALQQRLADYDDVICFGAGEISDLVSFFAPSTWAKVRAYAIDGDANGTQHCYRTLPLYYVSELPKDSVLLVCTRPESQEALYSRLSQTFAVVITWSDVVKMQ